MNDNKNLLSSLEWLPEYYLILIGFLAGYTPPFNINAMGIVIVVLGIVQLLFKNKVTGSVIACVCLLGNLLFGMAMGSELLEFQTINTNAIQLVATGSLIFLVNLLMSFLLLRKSLRTTGSQELNLN